MDTCLRVLRDIMSSQNCASMQILTGTDAAASLLQSFSVHCDGDDQNDSAANEVCDSLSKRVENSEPGPQQSNSIHENGCVYAIGTDDPHCQYTSPVPAVGTPCQSSQDYSRKATKTKTLQTYKNLNLPWFPRVTHGDWRHRVFIMFDDGSKSVIGKAIAIAVMLTVLLSTITFVLESMPAFRNRPDECNRLKHARQPLTVEACEPQPLPVFDTIEKVCIAIFTFEYFVRVATCHAAVGPTEHRLKLTLRYVKHPLNIIDLIAILPFYLTLGFDKYAGSNFSVVRVLRLARVLRMFKMAKHHPGMEMLIEVLVTSGEPLLILMFFNAIIVVLFASFIYFAEGTTFSVSPAFTQGTFDAVTNVTIPSAFPTGVYVRPSSDARTDEVTPFRSIPVSLWWACTTMTTVGYGDIYPTTPFGKTIAISCFYIGILFVALPISVLGMNFEMVYKKRIGNIRQVRNLDDNDGDGADRASQNHRSSIPMRELPMAPQGVGVREAIFTVFESPSASKLGLSVSIISMTAILVSTICFILESMPQFNRTPAQCQITSLSVESCKPEPHWFFNGVEVVCIIIFTIDYVCRVLLVHACKSQARSIKACLKVTVAYCGQGLNIIDLLAIAPFYLQLASGNSSGGQGVMAVLRLLRLIRVFRVMKLPKMRYGAKMFLRVIMDSLQALLILIFLSIITCVLFASCLVFAEGGQYSVNEFLDLYPYGVYVRPTVDGYATEPSPFKSIPAAFWWFFVTATTVGYGDQFPTTAAGRCIAVAAFYVGVVLLALPITIVGGNVTKYYEGWVRRFAPNTDKPNEAFDSDLAREAWS